MIKLASDVFFITNFIKLAVRQIQSYAYAPLRSRKNCTNLICNPEPNMTHRIQLMSTILSLIVRLAKKKWRNIPLQYRTIETPFINRLMISADCSHALRTISGDHLARRACSFILRLMFGVNSLVTNTECAARRVIKT